MKYFIFWALSFFATLLLLIAVMTMITNIGYNDIRGEDLLLLMYLGFSTVTASIATGVKYLGTLIKEKKEK